MQGYFMIYSVMDVSVSNGATITFNNLDDYAEGKTMNYYAACSVKSNNLWLVSVKANANYFTAGSGGSTDMPPSILSIRRSGTSTFYPLSASAAVNLTTGNRSGSTPPYYSIFNIDLFANPGYNYNGGSYSIGLVYTVTAQ